MADRILKDGQIVRYIGKDLVTYEKGKTYTVLGYDEKLDMYGILSELDEAYLLPEDILKPLSEDEEKRIRISDRMYEYYLDEEESSTAKDFDGIDEKRLSEIIRIAKDDIRNNRLKREREDFNSDAEFRIYLSDLAGEAYCTKLDIDTLSQPFSEHCLYINEFEPEHIVKTDDGDKYDWLNENSVFETSFSINDTRLRDYLQSTGKHFDGYGGGYPVASCRLLEREDLIQLSNSFPELFQSLDTNKLDKEQYVVIRCYWD